MLNWLKSLFSSGPDIGELLAEGAIVLDVRSVGEYQSGHVKGSMHVPLPQLSKKINAVMKRKKTVITVCASGMRSGKAAKAASHGRTCGGAVCGAVRQGRGSASGLCQRPRARSVGTAGARCRAERRTVLRVCNAGHCVLG